MFQISSAARLSFGLVILTTSILLIAEMLGLIPNRTTPIIEDRKRICGSFALYCSVAAQKKDHASIKNTMTLMVEQYEDILSVAVRDTNGALLAQAGNHGLYWKETAEKGSTATHVRVPIFEENNLWGTVEVSFVPIGRWGILGAWADTLTKLIVFVMLCGFVAYRLFLKTTLKNLDPSSVVPSRVKTALDSLAEGIVIIDENEQIVLANEVFAKKVGLSAPSLMGRKPSEFNWVVAHSNGKTDDRPWIQALQNKKNCIGVRMCLNVRPGHWLTFMVNGSPILDDGGRCRGVLVTFDDVTVIEEQNQQLQIMLKKLEKSQDEVELKNRKLKILATRDPLTGCLNRRAFFEILSMAHKAAVKQSQELCCVIFDLDHFKSINDKHGHAVGDMVLKGVAALIRSSLRKGDIFGRYGGEEFCICLRNVGIDNAIKLAERFRRLIESHYFDGIRVTASFGVSSIACGAKDVSDLVDQADQQLYRAKNSGRNRVEGLQVVSEHIDPDPLKDSVVEDNSDKTSEERKTGDKGDNRKTPKKILKRKGSNNINTSGNSSTTLRPNSREYLSDSERIPKNLNVASDGVSEKSTADGITKQENLVKTNQFVSGRITGSETEWSTTPPQNNKALKLAHEALNHSGKISESMGLNASINKGGDAAVQINKNGGWGDHETAGTRDRNRSKPIAKVAYILKQSKNGKFAQES